MPTPVSVPPLERKTARRIRAAEILDVTPRTIDRMCDSGRLKFIFVGSLKMITIESIRAVQEGRA
jgi:hypothetical protein